MSLFLGKRVDGGEEVNLKIETFLRHFICLGSSGSGKTVACKVICEEFVRNGIPVIAVDPQGDIASLMLFGDPEKIQEQGVSQEVFEEYSANAEVVIWTPASSKGVPLSLNPLILNLEGLDEDEVVHSLSLLSSSLTGLLGYNLEKDDGKSADAFFYMVFEYLNNNQLFFKDFGELASFIFNMPEGLSSSVLEIISEKEIRGLGKKLKLLTIGSKKLIFQLGVPLDIDTLLGRDDGEKTRVSVLYLNTLQSQEEKNFFMSSLIQNLYRWMLRNPSKSVQALFYIDEIAPYIPPVRKPPCKEALRLLFKQARKYGVACLVATQNPGDLDYTALSQFGTWGLGRLMTRQDIRKVEGVIKAIDPGKTDFIVKKLPKLSSGEFLLLCPDEFEDVVPFNVRWLVTEHVTLNESDIAKLIPGEIRDKFASNTVSNVETQEPVIEVEVGLKDEIIEELKNRPGCYTVSEIADAVEGSRDKVGEELKGLVKGGDVESGRFGKDFVYWWKDYRFNPYLGIVRPVQIAKLMKTERDVRKTVEKTLEGSFVFKKESVEDTSFINHPLWKIPVSVEVKKGFISRTTVEESESLYIDAVKGKLCVYDTKFGFSFVAIVDKSPLKIKDLDDVCAFETKLPCEMDLDKRRLKKMISARDAQKTVERKYGVKTDKASLVFIPLWKFKIKHKEKKKPRYMTLDGITGKQFLGS